MLPASNGVGRKREEDDSNKYDARGSGGGGGGSLNISNMDPAKSSGLVDSNNGAYSKTASTDYLNELLNLYKKQPGGGGGSNDFDIKPKGMSYFIFMQISHLRDRFTKTIFKSFHKESYQL